MKRIKLQDIKDFVDTWGYACDSEGRLDISFLENLEIFHKWRKIKNKKKYSNFSEEAKEFSNWCAKYYPSK
jgi:hypothetical protein